MAVRENGRGNALALLCATLRILVSQRVTLDDMEGAIASEDSTHTTRNMNGRSAQTARRHF